jgi:hypothetical protein
MTHDMTKIESANTVETYAELTTEVLGKRASAAIKCGEADIKQGKTKIKHGEGLLLTAGIYLSVAKQRVHADGSQTWPEWLEQNCKVAVSRADDLIMVGEGRTTVAELRSKTAERVAKHREAKKAVPVTTPNVTGNTPAAPAAMVEYNIDDEEVEAEPEATVTPAPVITHEISLDPEDFDQRLADAYSLGVKDGYAEGFAAGVASVKRVRPSTNYGNTKWSGKPPKEDEPEPVKKTRRKLTQEEKDEEEARKLRAAKGAAEWKEIMDAYLLAIEDPKAKAAAKKLHLKFPTAGLALGIDGGREKGSVERLKGAVILATWARVNGKIEIELKNFSKQEEERKNLAAVKTPDAHMEAYHFMMEAFDRMKEGEEAVNITDDAPPEYLDWYSVRNWLGEREERREWGAEVNKEPEPQDISPYMQKFLGIAA